MNNKLKKKGFLLFEVTLTIAILAVGLFFVIRAISMCVRTAKASFNYSRAINLVSQKAFELELKSFAGGVSTLSAEGEFSGDEQFTWQYSIDKFSQDEYKNLGKLNLGISWKEGKREAELGIATYVKTKEE